MYSMGCWDDLCRTGQACHLQLAALSIINNDHRSHKHDMALECNKSITLRRCDL